ncbi:MAG TPA: membrane protein insertion efficiency factor YidD [Prolixibacteraceae bacterium]|nr:membrane protein insertion efficiency factor YidD [Prolixibacteraceae bacterium]
MIKFFSRYLFPLVILFAVSGNLWGNNPSKQDKLSQLNKPKKTKTDFSKYLKNSTNELEATAAILFVGYKDFLSSQDMNSCVFTPSCSVYAIESIQNDNLFVAYLKIFDRLSRCHPFVAKGEYHFLPQNQTFYDPIH